MLHINMIVNEKKGFVNRVKQIGNKWQVKSLIHGDIRFANFILTGSTKTKIKLIDWEISDFGDPLWDVAGVFQSFLYYWVVKADAKAVVLQSIR